MLASDASVAEACDAALAESFVDAFKTGLTAARVWRTRTQLQLVIVEYVNRINATRLHEALGDVAARRGRAPGRGEDHRLGLQIGAALSPRPPICSTPRFERERAGR